MQVSADLWEVYATCLIDWSHSNGLGTCKVLNICLSILWYKIYDYICRIYLCDIDNNWAFVVIHLMYVTNPLFGFGGWHGTCKANPSQLGRTPLLGFVYHLCAKNIVCIMLEYLVKYKAFLFVNDTWSTLWMSGTYVYHTGYPGSIPNIGAKPGH